MFLSGYVGKFLDFCNTESQLMVVGLGPGGLDSWNPRK